MKNQIEKKFYLFQPSDLDVFLLDSQRPERALQDSDHPGLRRELRKARFNKASVLRFEKDYYLRNNVGYFNLVIRGSEHFSKLHEETPVIKLMAVSDQKTFRAYAALRILRTEEALEFFCTDGLDPWTDIESKEAYEAFKMVLPEGELPVVFFEECVGYEDETLSNSLWLMAIQFALRQGVCAIVAVETSKRNVHHIEGEKLVWDDFLEGPFIFTENIELKGPFIFTENIEVGNAMKIVPRASFLQARDKLIEQGTVALEWIGEVPAELKDLA